MCGTVFLIRGESPLRRSNAAARIAASMAAPATILSDADTLSDDEIRLRLADGEGVICVDEAVHERAVAIAESLDAAVAEAASDAGTVWVSLDSLEVVSGLLSECSGGLRACYGRRLPNCLRQWADSHPEDAQRALRLAERSDRLDLPGRLGIIARSDLWQRQKHRF